MGKAKLMIQLLIQRSIKEDGLDAQEAKNSALVYLGYFLDNLASKDIKVEDAIARRIDTIRGDLPFTL